MFEKLFLCGDYPQKLQHASCASVLTSLIQTCFWSIVNSLVIVNRWTEVLVTASSKCSGIKSVLHFNGTPHLPFHSMPPRIIISLISQGLFKWCVSYRSAVSMSSIKPGTSCIGKWDWKDESYLLAFVCHSSVQRWDWILCPSAQFAAHITGRTSRQAGSASASMGQEVQTKGAECKSSFSTCRAPWASQMPPFLRKNENPLLFYIFSLSQTC